MHVSVSCWCVSCNLGQQQYQQIDGQWAAQTSPQWCYASVGSPWLRAWTRRQGSEASCVDYSQGWPDFHLLGHPSHGRSASNLSPGHFWHLGSQVWPGEPAAVLHILYSQWCQFTTAHTSLWDLVVKFLVILLTDVKPPVTWNQLWWENLHTEEIKCYREGPCVGFLCSQLVFWHHSRTRSSHAALD